MVVVTSMTTPAAWCAKQEPRASMWSCDCQDSSGSLLNCLSGVASVADAAARRRPMHGPLATTLLDPITRVSPSPLIMRLGKDETDVDVKDEEETIVVRFDKSRSTYVVQLHGDHYVPNLFEEEHDLVHAVLTGLAQLPHRVKDNRLPLPSDLECQAWIVTVRDYMDANKITIQALHTKKCLALKRLQTKLAKDQQQHVDADGAMREALDSKANLDKMEQSIIFQQSAVCRAKAVITEMRSLDAMLHRQQLVFERRTFEDLVVQDAWRTIVSVADAGMRTLAKKLLMYRTWDCTHGDKSVTAAQFFTRCLKQPEEMAIDNMVLQKLKGAGIPQMILTGDGAFMTARSQTMFVGTRDRIAKDAMKWAHAAKDGLLERRGWKRVNTGTPKAFAIKGELLKLLEDVMPAKGRPVNKQKQLPDIPGAVFFPAPFRCDPAKAKSNQDECRQAYFDKGGDQHCAYDKEFLQRDFACEWVTGSMINEQFGRSDGHGSSPIEAALPDTALSEAEISEAEERWVSAQDDQDDFTEREQPVQSVKRRLALAKHAVDDETISVATLVAELAQAAYENRVHAYVSEGRDFERYMSVGDPAGVYRDEDNCHLIKCFAQGVQRGVNGLAEAIRHDQGEIEKQEPAYAEEFQHMLYDRDPAIRGSVRWGKRYKGVLDSKSLMQAAGSKKRFQPIKRWLAGKADKQNVPLAMQLFFDRLYITRLRYHGCKSEAFFLQVMGQFYGVWDFNHLQQDYRDYMVERGRILMHAVLGSKSHDCAALIKMTATSSKVEPAPTPPAKRMKHDGGMQTSALYRSVCHADVREQVNLRCNFPAMEKKVGSTNDVENCFSQLTKITGYKPTAKKAAESLKKAEMNLADEVDEEMVLESVALMQRTPDQLTLKRRAWHSGLRVETFWPTEPAEEDAGPPAKRRCMRVTRSFKTERRAWGAQAGKGTTVRQQQHLQAQPAGFSDRVAGAISDGEDS